MKEYKSIEDLRKNFAFCVYEAAPNRSSDKKFDDSLQERNFSVFSEKDSIGKVLEQDEKYFTIFTSMGTPSKLRLDGWVENVDEDAENNFDLSYQHKLQCIRSHIDVFKNFIRDEREHDIHSPCYFNIVLGDAIEDYNRLEESHGSQQWAINFITIIKSVANVDKIYEFSKEKKEKLKKTISRYLFEIGSESEEIKKNKSELQIKWEVKLKKETREIVEDLNEFLWKTADKNNRAKLICFSDDDIKEIVQSKGYKERFDYLLGEFIDGLIDLHTSKITDNGLSEKTQDYLKKNLTIYGVKYFIHEIVISHMHFLQRKSFKLEQEENGLVFHSYAGFVKNVFDCGLGKLDDRFREVECKAVNVVQTSVGYIQEKSQLLINYHGCPENKDDDPYTIRRQILRKEHLTIERLLTDSIDSNSVEMKLLKGYKGDYTQLEKQQTVLKSNSCLIKLNASDSRYGSDLKELESEFFQPFLDDDSKQLILIGESGSGKSHYLRHLVRKCWVNYINKPENERHIPIHIDLRAVEFSDDKNFPGSFLKSYLKNTYGLDETDYNYLKGRKLLLFLDSYDKNNGGNCNIFENNIACNESEKKQCDWKFIISCKSSYFESLEEEGQKAAFSVAGEKLIKTAYIAPLDISNQIQPFVSEYIENTAVGKDKKNVPEIITKLRELVRSPLYLTLILGRMQDLLLKSSELNEITKFKLIEDSFIKYFENIFFDSFNEFYADKKKAKYKKCLKSRVDIMMRCCSELSEEMLCKEGGFSEELLSEKLILYKTHFSSDEFPELSLEEFEKSLPLNYLFKDRKKLYYFEHEIVREFFLARLIANEIYSKKIKKRVCKKSKYSLDKEKLSGSLFSIDYLSKFPGVIAFLAEQSNEKTGLLLEIVMLSKNDESKAIRKASSNAMTILCALKFNFSGMNLDGIKIPYANFYNAMFHATSLRGADCTGVNFNNAYCENLKLDNTTLKGVIFRGVDFKNKIITSIKFCRNEKLVAIALGKNIEVWSQNFGHLKYKLLGHKADVKEIVFDKGQIITVSIDLEIRYWDLKGSCFEAKKLPLSREAKPFSILNYPGGTSRNMRCYISKQKQVLIIEDRAYRDDSTDKLKQIRITMYDVSCNKLITGFYIDCDYFMLFGDEKLGALVVGDAGVATCYFQSVIESVGKDVEKTYFYLREIAIESRFYNLYDLGHWMKVIERNIDKEHPVVERLASHIRGVELVNFDRDGLIPNALFSFLSTGFPIKRFGIDQHGKLLAGVNENHLQVWCCESKKLIFDIVLQESDQYKIKQHGLIFDKTGEYLATISKFSNDSDLHKVQVYKLKDKACFIDVSTLFGINQIIFDINQKGEGSIVLVGDSKIQIENIRQYKSMDPNFGTTISCLAYNREGDHIAIGYSNGAAQVWDVARGVVLNALPGNPGLDLMKRESGSIMFCPDSENVAMMIKLGLSNVNLCIWTLQDGRSKLVPLPKGKGRISVEKYFSSIDFNRSSSKLFNLVLRWVGADWPQWYRSPLLNTLSLGDHIHGEIHYFDSREDCLEVLNGEMVLSLSKYRENLKSIEGYLIISLRKYFAVCADIQLGQMPTYYVGKIEGTQIHVLGNFILDSPISNAQYYPNSNYFVFTSMYGVYSLSLPEMEVKNLESIDLENHYCRFSYKPDFSGFAVTNSGVLHLWELGAEPKCQKITGIGCAVNDFSWSPDGKTISVITDHNILVYKYNPEIENYLLHWYSGPALFMKKNLKDWNNETVTKLGSDSPVYSKNQKDEFNKQDEFNNNNYSSDLDSSEMKSNI